MNNKVLKITKTNWSGWPGDHKPLEEVSEHDIRVGEKIELNRAKLALAEGERVDVLEVTITEVGENSITIETSKAMAVRKKGESGMSMTGKGTTFMVSDTEKLEIATLTMDYGDIYIFEIIDKVL